MPQLALVSGGNGHLGNNLIRLLLAKGIKVRTTVRNVNNVAPFKGLDCEVVHADLMDKTSFVKALQGVDVFYAVAANFKLWAKDPQTEIYDNNLIGTRNVIEAAHEAGVKRIVYVSSIAALNYDKIPTKEDYGYNTNRLDTYYNSKNDSEKLAFELAKQYDIELVAVMPSAMIGSEAFAPLNTSYNVLQTILKNRVPVDTGITVNWVDVKDVAEGCWLASEKGRAGERYILANEKCLTLTQTIQIAQQLFPELKLITPMKVPDAVLWSSAWLLEMISKITNKAPMVTRKELNMFAGLQQDFEISKARTELGFNPKSPTQAVIEALVYLHEEYTK